MKINPIQNNIVRPVQNKFYIKDLGIQDPEYNANFDNSLLEAIGRSQVNFMGGADKHHNLTAEDEEFVDVIGKIFRASKEEIEQAKIFTSEFLDENNFDSIDGIRCAEESKYYNKLAYLSENICKIFNMGDMESFDLDELIFKYMACGDIKKCGDGPESVFETYRYSADQTACFDVLTNYCINYDKAFDIFKELRVMAQDKDFDSIFDLFKEENVKNNSLNTFFNNYTSKGTASDIFLDFYELAKKSHRERLEGINMCPYTNPDGINL